MLIIFLLSAPFLCYYFPCEKAEIMKSFSRRHRYSLRPMWAELPGRFYPFRLLADLAGVLDMVGRWDRTEEIYRRNLEAARAGDDRELIADSCGSLADLLIKQGEFDQALPLIGESREIYSGSGNKRGLAVALTQLGLVHYHRGNIHPAQENYEKLLQLAGELDDNGLRSKAYSNFGSLYFNLGQFDQAAEYMIKDLELCRLVSDKRGESFALNNIGVVCLVRGDLDGAEKYFRQKLEISKQLGDKYGLGFVYGNLGELFFCRRDFPQALEYCRLEEDCSRELGDKEGLIHAYNTLGMACGTMGDARNSESYYFKQLEIAREIGHKRSCSMALVGLADLKKMLKEYGPAGEYYSQAIALGRELEAPSLLCGYLQALAELRLLQEKRAEARQLNREALEMAERVDNREYVFKARLLDLKLSAAADPAGAEQGILSLLDDEKIGPPERASILYELFKLTGGEDYRGRARESYQELFRQSPGQEARQRLEELSGGKP